MTFARAPPYASAPASLRAKGTYAALSPEVAGLCGSTSQASWGKPKAVVAYLPPSERATGPTRFSTCSPGTALDHTLWLLSCPRGLITPDGSDAADAGEMGWGWGQADQGAAQCRRLGPGPVALGSTLCLQPWQVQTALISATPPAAQLSCLASSH